MLINGSFHTSGASIAHGSPRTIGQKPEPTIRRGMTHKASLREGGFPVASL